MERIHTLIDKLYQQKNAGASPAHLLFTVQLLQQELSQLQSRNGSLGTKKVSVTLPVSLNFSEESLRNSFTETKAVKEFFVLDTLLDDVVAGEPVPPVVSFNEPKEYIVHKPVIKENIVEDATPVKREEPKPSYSTQELFNSAFDAIIEAPTLTQYANRKEVQHTLTDLKESLNDRLKEERLEVAHRIKETPIKDLRKAVGINDRFVFVKELFRGDEAAYERSIKTINGFHIYSEAEYWMARELRLKLAWADDNENVKHFYQLVRRRFS